MTHAQNTSPSAAAPGARGTRRRTLLKAAGLSTMAIAGTSGLAHAGTRTAKGTAASARNAYDAIVIGAGFAGVTAARELGAKGLRTLILEARNRIGGRTWTTTFAGEQVEMGGTWVDELQPNAWREVQRYKLPLVTDAGPEYLILPAAGGGFDRFDPVQAGTHQGQLITALFDGSREYFPRPYEPLFRADLLQEVDRLSLRDRLDQLRYSPQDESWVNGVTSGLSGGNSKDGGLATLAHQWALSGWNLDGFNGVNSDRPTAGTAGLLRAMLKDAPLHTLKLGAPVASIDDDGQRVQVTTRCGERFTAPTAVVAVPANVWQHIAFPGGLPAEFTTVSRAGIAAPRVKKVWIHVRGDHGRFIAQGSEGSPLNSVLTHSTRSDGQILTAFSVDPTLDVADPVALQTALRAYVPGAEVLSLRAQNWGSDEFSLGGWTFRRPGQLTKYLRAIQQPQGRLAFAGSDIASGWSGFIDGAIESGFVAAEQAATLARRGRRVPVPG